jgi:hypothetical protein
MPQVNRPGALTRPVRGPSAAPTLSSNRTCEMGPALIEMISVAMSLERDDVIITGTPRGVGAARKPPVFMRPGDIFEVEIEGLGVLTNSVEEG